MSFSVQSEALVCLDDPIVLRFFVWVVTRAAKKKTKVTSGRVPVTLERGQLAFSRNAATRDLHHRGFTEREIEYSLKECLRLQLIEEQDFADVKVLTLNPGAVIIGDALLPTLPKLEQDIMEVLQHHVETFPDFGKGIKKNGPTWNRVKKRLEDGFSLEDLKAAISGNAADKWWASKNLHSLELILKERHIARFIHLGRNSKPLADSWIESSEEAENVFDSKEPLQWREGKRDDTRGQTTVCNTN